MKTEEIRKKCDYCKIFYHRKMLKTINILIAVRFLFKLRSIQVLEIKHEAHVIDINQIKRYYVQ